MAQTIKFVYESGKVRIQTTYVDLTKKVIKDLQHDYQEMLPGGDLNKVKYFVLTDGNFAPEPPRKKHHHATSNR